MLPSQRVGSSLVRGMVRPEATLLAPTASSLAKLLLPCLPGFATHPANLGGPGLPVAGPSGLFKGHELEATSSSTWTSSAATRGATSTTTSAGAPCSEPEPLRLVGEGHRATIKVPVVLTFLVVLVLEAVGLACCLRTWQGRITDWRSRQPLGASRIQVQ